ncbi:MAG TPA: glutaredoxin [Flavobacteriales bacterium]|nr:glutaredoxin [Flavobacteriales bacterium]
MWCDRVKVLLTDTGYELDEKPVRDNMEVLYALNNNEDIKSIPQVVIDGKLVGGYSEVETLIREIKSINRV